MPAQEPSPAPPLPAVCRLTLGQPMVWLDRGWNDLVRCPLPGMLHGAAAALFGWAVLLGAWEHFWIMAGAFSGFLIVAPIVATGLYAVSRGLEQGQHLGVRGVLRVWRSQDPRLMHFGLLLALAGTGWVFTSAAMVTSFAEAPIHKPLDFLRYVVLSETGWVFEAWLMLGGVLAAPVFASSVVAIPLLLDRPVSVETAVLTSWRAVQANPATLALWAAVLWGITGLAMLLGLVGLVVAVPWLAHASWHAYRDLVAPAAGGATRAGSRAGPGAA
jgi:uncharacterized membrane protein